MKLKLEREAKCAENCVDRKYEINNRVVLLFLNVLSIFRIRTDKINLIIVLNCQITRSNSNINDLCIKTRDVKRNIFSRINNI